jgi:ferredoxin
MKIEIDQSLCAGHGRCYSLAPDLIEADDEGFPTRQGQPIDVPAGQEEAARKVIANCPEGAVRELEG